MAYISTHMQIADIITQSSSFHHCRDRLCCRRVRARANVLVVVACRSHVNINNQMMFICFSFLFFIFVSGYMC